MERKASEVLLELEKKVDQILQYLKNIDFNNKLILERLNKAPVEPAAAPKPVTSPPQRKMPSVESVSSPGKTVLVSKPPVKPPAEYEFHEVDEEGNPQIQEELQPKTGRRDIRTPIKQGQKTQVQQKIIYPDGKNVILANVEIFTTVLDARGKLEKTAVGKPTRTNSAGKWLAALDPGRYTIRIFKGATSNKPVVEHVYEVEIPLSEAPIELEPLQV